MYFFIALEKKRLFYQEITIFDSKNIVSHFPVYFYRIQCVRSSRLDSTAAVFYFCIFISTFYKNWCE